VCVAVCVAECGAVYYSVLQCVLLPCVAACSPPHLTSSSSPFLCVAVHVAACCNVL